MFEEYEHVTMIRSGRSGLIVDKRVTDGKTWYMVESDIQGPIEGGYGDLWPLFDCTDEDLERVPESRVS